MSTARKQTRSAKGKNPASKEKPASSRRTAPARKGKGQPKPAGVLEKAGAAGTTAGRVLAEGLFTDIILDLIKPEGGWHVALHSLTELLNSMPFTGFVSLVRENTQPRKKVLPAEYDAWVNALFIVLADIQAQVDELHGLMEKYEVEHDEVAAFLAKRLADSFGNTDSLNYANVRKFVENYGLFVFLNKTLSPTDARKVGMKLKI